MSSCRRTSGHSALKRSRAWRRDPFAVLVEHENAEPAKALLGGLIRGRTRVDTNFGELIEFSEFVRRMETEPDWAWRS
ncbi:hypothetical protein QFZ32_004165 [Streptomyces canus]|uniref:Uncharacterized protein n=1 Tax=Streptomyces canus TaxID=58343 RepID=A0AAW8FHP1_9ACTN|nr:hypothetical protein [Streptomyces canus]MDQ0908726.1 hypothetical protein [Streptomyces canus]MDQ1068725.1 hypothetical protein [Streptomyces canus]